MQGTTTLSCDNISLNSSHNMNVFRRIL